MADNIGRPPKFKTPEDMQMAIDDYFGSVTYTDDNGITHCKPTVCGLALALNLSRQGLIEYGEKEAFSDTVKKAKQRVQMAIENHLLYSGQATGAIFNLKNNFGWVDKKEVEQTGNMSVTIESDDAKTL